MKNSEFSTLTNYELIPICSTIGGTACSTSWMLYGFYQGDILLVIPNALGVIATIIKIIIYVFFMAKKKLIKIKELNR